MSTPDQTRKPPRAVRSGLRSLDAIFSPRHVAVIGASESPNSIGRTVLWNLISSPFGGTVYPVNPRRPSVMGIKTYPSIRDIDDPIDLAVVVTPAPTAPNIIAQCADAGVKAAIIISGGFSESTDEGADLERQILEHARRGNMRIMGPNCIGVMSTVTGLNTTFSNVMARSGNVGFISQSGALCMAILDWSLRENTGFSAFVSIGAMLDVGWGDLIYYLGDDPRTKSIVLYMESVGDARSFLSAAREVAFSKPVIVIKAGKTRGSAGAVTSHTGALAGDDAVLDAAFRRCGVLRVQNLEDLFHMAEVLAKQPRPKGPRLTIVSNAGGPAVLAADEITSIGGELAEMSEETMAALNELLPPHWSRGNPIDILADADAERYAKTLEIATTEPNSDGCLVITAPHGVADPTQTAELIKPQSKGTGKPLLASWMGGDEVVAGQDILNRAQIPTFPFPENAARAFHYMWRYTYNLRGLYETPMLPRGADEDTHARDHSQEIINAAKSEGRTLLTEVESKEILAAYGIPVVETRTAFTEEEAVALAVELGYPAVLKLLSRTVTHKSDVGGVRLNLCNEQAVRSAYRAIRESVAEKAGAQHFEGVSVQPMVRAEGYEVIIGSSLDPQFGPVLMFGAGGQLVEVVRDRALALPPLNTTLARRALEQTQVYKALQGVRGRPPVDLAALEQIFVRFSQLVIEQPWIREVDINPLLASADEITALDARVVLHDPQTPEVELPRPAIRPYPTQYVAPHTLKNGEAVTIRPIRPEDEPLMVKFHETLSDQSVYFRYLHSIKLSARVAHERLARICFIDYDCEMALVADHIVPEAGEHEILGVGRLSLVYGKNEAEFAILISDECQGQGLGTELLRRLVQIGRDEGLDRITAEMLHENVGMQRVSEKVGFRLEREIGDAVARAVIDL